HVAYAFDGHLRERREGGADDRDRRYAEGFECGRVTRGPGRRRPSVSDAVEDGVAFARHLLGVRRSDAEIALLPEAHFRDAVIALQHFGDSAQHEIGELLAVVEDAYPCAFEPL